TPSPSTTLFRSAPMSLDLVILTPGSARTYEQALRVYYEQDPGEPEAQSLQAFAGEIEARYAEGDWPFTGNPIVMPSHLLLSVGYESWDQVVPHIVSEAHRHGFVVLDPQYEKLFPPGTPYR